MFPSFVTLTFLKTLLNPFHEREKEYIPNKFRRKTLPTTTDKGIASTPGRLKKKGKIQWWFGFLGSDEILTGP